MIANSRDPQDAVLTVRNLCVDTVSLDTPKRLVHDVSLHVAAGETLCIVGESGSGKSLTAFSVMGLLPRDALQVAGGEVSLLGQDVLRATPEAVRLSRGSSMSMIFQEPMTALNPIQRVGDQIEETVIVHRKLPARERKQLIMNMLGEVGLSDTARIARSYPHQLSGGQRQRIMIAMALILEPKLLIADEPTTALDVSTQKKILHLIKALQRHHGTAVIFITHDFGVVREIADRVLVMKEGRMVETGEASAILSNPAQQYTRELIMAVPSMIPKSGEKSFAKSPKVLEVCELSKTYGWKSVFARKQGTAALVDASFDLHRGEVTSIVGESGSGKSTFARCIVGLVESSSGEIRLDGTQIPPSVEKRSSELRRKIQIIFQDPYRSLNPRRRIGDSLMEGPVNFGMDRADVATRIDGVLSMVGLDKDVLRRYPHQFSGGQRQRICIARAVILDPLVLIADEAVSALDVTIQKKVLELLADIRERTQISVLFITHDLRTAAQISDNIIVMQKGHIVEQGRPEKVILSPQQDYTKSLIEAAPGTGWDFGNFRPYAVEH